MKSHGLVEFHWEQNILIVNAFGPFNEEGIREGTEQLKQSVLEQKPENWSRLEILDTETLGSPETLEIVRQLYSWFRAKGCEHVAIVASTALLKELIVSTMDARINFFDNAEDAMEWLRSLNK